MTNTILPKKASDEQPFAANDRAHSQLVADPTITQFTNNDSNISDPGNATPGIQSARKQLSGSTDNTSIPRWQSKAIDNFGELQQQQSTSPVLTNAGTNAAVGADILVANDNTVWLNKKWRPLMAGVYMITCVADFVIFPILWSILQALSKGQVTNQWQPLTLQGAGLYHIAMGAVLGITAFGRTKEKIAGAA